MATNYGWMWQLGCPCCGVTHYLYAVGSDRGGSGAPILQWVKYTTDGSPSAQGGGDPSGGTIENLYAVDVDDDGNWYYCAANGSLNYHYRFYKRDSSDTLILESDENSQSHPMSRLAANNSGQVAFVTASGSGGYTGMFNADGTEAWLVQYDGTLNGGRSVQWLPDGNLAFAGGDGSSGSASILVIKNPVDGSKLDEIATTGLISDLVVDNAGNLYLLDTVNLRKYNSSLVLQWTAALSGSYAGNGFAVGPGGESYIPYVRGSDTSKVLEKIDSSGVSQWTITSNQFSTKMSLRNAICDTDGNVYASGETHVLGSSTNDLQGHIQKFDSSGNSLWTASPLSGHLTFYGVCTTQRRPNWWV